MNEGILPITSLACGVLVHVGYVVCFISSADYSIKRWGVCIAVLVTFISSTAYSLLFFPLYSYACDPATDNWHVAVTRVVSELIFSKGWLGLFTFSVVAVLLVFMLEKRRDYPERK